MTEASPAAGGYVPLYRPQRGPCVTCGEPIHVAFVNRVGEAWVHVNRLGEDHRAIPHDDRLAPRQGSRDEGGETKMVIVCRHDLGRGTKGKWMAQAGHASMIWLAERLGGSWRRYAETTFEDLYPWTTLGVFTAAEYDWLRRSFAKIVVHVPDEQALREIWERAKDAGLQVFPCVDAGNTVFPEPTLTCIGIGPDWASRLDPVTGSLPLF